MIIVLNDFSFAFLGASLSINFPKSHNQQIHCCGLGSTAEVSVEIKIARLKINCYSGGHSSLLILLLVSAFYY